MMAVVNASLIKLGRFMFSLLRMVWSLVCFICVVLANRFSASLHWSGSSQARAATFLQVERLQFGRYDIGSVGYLRIAGAQGGDAAQLSPRSCLGVMAEQARGRSDPRRLRQTRFHRENGENQAGNSAASER
jgi:hypothetical protein